MRATILLSTIQLFVLLLITCIASTSATVPPQNRLKPLPPSQDPFYTAPPGYESKAPGRTLRYRPARGNLTTLFANASATYNILYSTSDAHYQPSWAVTTLFVPEKKNGVSCDALLSYQIPYNAADVDASPSYALYSGPSVYPDILAALGRGWCVNVPDFEGPLASFGLGIQEGYATLDSVRAVLAFESHGFNTNISRYAMWGYSGGSIASEWAAELQAQYGPELNFSGVAIGGLPVNASEALILASGTPFAGDAPAGLMGATSQFPVARAYLLNQLKESGPHNKTGFLAVQNMSIAEAFVAFANQSIWDYFTDGLAVMSAPPLREMWKTNGIMGYHGIPSMPMFVYKAIHDELAPIKDTDVLVQRYCGVGVNIIYQRNEIGGHLAEATNGDARAFDWLASVLDGTYKPSADCTVQNVRINVTDSPL